jgi:hypothetical protein
VGWPSAVAPRKLSAADTPRRSALAYLPPAPRRPLSFGLANRASLDFCCRCLSPCSGLAMPSYCRSLRATVHAIA